MEIDYTQMAIDEIYKRSNGRLQIEFYPAFSLGYNPGTWLRDMKEGVIDASFIFPAISAGEEPSFAVLETAEMWISRGQSLLAGEALVPFKKRVYKDVWNSELIVSGTMVSHRGGVYTRGIPIRVLDDLKGLKIRVNSSRLGALYTLLEISPQVMPLGEVYMGLKTGVLDGFYSGPISAWEGKTYEVTDYFLETGPASYLAEDIVISNKRWDALSPDLQEIVYDVFAKWNAGIKGRVAYHLATPRGGVEHWWNEKLEEVGMTWNALPEEDLVKIRELAMKVQVDWVKKTGGRTAEAWEIIKPFVIPPTDVSKAEPLFPK